MTVNEKLIYYLARQGKALCLVPLVLYQLYFCRSFLSSHYQAVSNGPVHLSSNAKMCSNQML